MNERQKLNTDHHVLIIGGGFGGLHATQGFKDAPVKVTVVDKRNFHLFQPLLYQVATGGLSPGDISSPLRAILKGQENTTVLNAEVVDILPDEGKVVLQDGFLEYDTLIVAAGARNHYFGNDSWEPHAPGLKTVEDALGMRRRILLAFEAAEREPDPQTRRAWLTFVIVGGGPTGVELAGAIAELAKSTLREDFRRIDPSEAEIILLEGTEEILQVYPTSLSGKAKYTLQDLGITVRTDAFVTGITPEEVTVRQNGKTETIPTRTVLWAAGMKASRLGDVLGERTGAPLDRGGRVIVQPDLSVPGYPDIFVVGDMANYSQDGEPLPGVAPVAMQQGDYVASLIKARLSGSGTGPFRYRDKGMLAVIGRNAAIADFGSWRTHGFLAWWIWIFLHIWYLIGFDNKILVLVQWAWNYFTRKRGARLITGPDPFPLVEKTHQGT